MLSWVVPEFNVEWLREIVEFPYRIIYRVKPEMVEVAAIVHGSRELKRWMLPDHGDELK